LQFLLLASTNLELVEGGISIEAFFWKLPDAPHGWLLAAFTQFLREARGRLHRKMAQDTSSDPVRRGAHLSLAIV